MDGSRAEEVMMQQDPQDRCSEEDVLTGRYEILKTLGTGTFAQVKLARHLLTDFPVALKIQEKDETNSATIKHEQDIMKILDHPNIIQLFHIFETAKNIYMVLEYASGGDLASHISEVEHMPEVEVRRIFKQLACAVKYCHENEIAHRDIKPENILMDENKNVKLCNFRLAINVAAVPVSRDFCGTLPYCAPELFSSQGYDPRAIDIWSMGVVLYIMVTKRFPFKGETYDQMKINMQEPRCHIPPKLPVHIASLIIKLFTTDPGQRPKIHEIIEHQWLKDSEEFSKPTLSLEPLPNKPNPCVMAAMWGMGYSPKDIRDSLAEEKFDNIMATYLILEYHSPWEEDFHIAMIPDDPPTCHYFLKSIGSEPDNSTSTLPGKYRSQGNNKLVKNKDRKNHSMPAIHCCQQKSQPHSTGVQCGPLQHGHEHLLSSRASKSMSCGPVLHVHEYHLCSTLQKGDTVSRRIPQQSCGPVLHNQDEHLLSITLQKRSRVFKRLSCGPVHHNHDEQLTSSLQKIKRVSKSISCGPAQPNPEQFLSSSLQKRGRASKSVFCGPVQHDLEQHLDILSENHITQVEAQNENPHKSSSFLQHTPSLRISEEGLEDVTTTDAHQDKSLTPQETSEPNLTSAQPQRVTVASPRLWGGWKQVKRRLVKGLRRLCCCLPAEKRSRIFQRRVTPQEGGDNGVT